MKKISELLTGIAECNLDINIKDISIDSRKVKEGDLFICISGLNDDGHKHSIEAEMLGAAAIVCEKEVESNLPQIIVKNSREAYAIISKNFFESAIDSLKFVAVVGTNGKTSTATILNCILTEAGYKTGQIGTLCYKILDKEIEADMTTPDPYTLHKLFYKMKKSGVEIVISEVSAHAIYHRKLLGCIADIAIFTNVSQDHLDFFKDMEAYSATKMSYFNKNMVKMAVINSDDGIGRKIIAKKLIPTISYGINDPADVFAIDIKHTLKGTGFVINLFDNVFEISSPLFGVHNVYNVLAAITAAKLLSVPSLVILKAVEELKEIDGRFNILTYKGGRIVVDFAHTPDGLENLLKASKDITSGNLYAVFGCGGNRDKGKRIIMGRLAAKYADFVILTSDNPRYEEPMDIIMDIAEGVAEITNKYALIEDRKEAIAFAVERMAEGDTVVIAGKGGEKYTEIKGKKYKSDDLSEVKDFIRGRKIE